MDETRKLYDVLVRDGYYTKSFEDFQVQLNDPAYVDKVYGVVTRDGLFTQDKEVFIEKYKVKKKTKKKSLRNQNRKLVLWNRQSTSPFYLAL